MSEFITWSYDRFVPEGARLINPHEADGFVRYQELLEEIMPIRLGEAALNQVDYKRQSVDKVKYQPEEDSGQEIVYERRVLFRCDAVGGIAAHDMYVLRQSYGGDLPHPENTQLVAAGKDDNGEGWALNLMQRYARRSMLYGGNLEAYLLKLSQKLVRIDKDLGDSPPGWLIADDRPDGR
jgi:hypothetical protein